MAIVKGKNEGGSTADRINEIRMLNQSMKNNPVAGNETDDFDEYRDQYLTNIPPEQEDGAKAQSELLGYAIIRYMMDEFTQLAMERAENGPNGEKFVERFKPMLNALPEEVASIALNSLSANPPEVVAHDLRILTDEIYNSLLRALQTYMAHAASQRQQPAEGNTDG